MFAPSRRLLGRSFVLAVGFAVLISTAGLAADDLPAETKILITKLKDEMKSKTPKVRIAAYSAMGELGEKAKGERRTLCQGFLDGNPMVQAAAADALKKVDEGIHKMALAIAVDHDLKTIEKAGGMARDAEPLIPLIFGYATTLAGPASNDPPADGVGAQKNAKVRHEFHVCLGALVSIDAEDLDINKAVIGVLSNRRGDNRAYAMKLLPKLKNKKLALGPVAAIASNPKEEAKHRITAINLIPELVDENTTPNAIKGLEALRFEKDQAVRDAIDANLKKLK